MSLRARVALPVIVTFLLAACTEDPVAPPGVAVVEIHGIPATLEVGDTVRLAARVTDRNGNEVGGVVVQWSSENPAIATLSAEGLATAVGEGTVTVRASAEGVPATAPLTVSRPAPLRFASLVVGDNHACGLTSDGALYCWGYNNRGQLGTTAMLDGCSVTNWQGKEETVSCSARPIRVHGPGRFAAVATGTLHTCALTPSGMAQCWGDNGWEHLGAAWDVLSSSPAPINVAGGHAFTKLSLGNWFSCGLTSAGEAYCWGSHAWGELGTGDLELFTSPRPVGVVGGHRFTALAGGSLHNCGLLASGQAYCWGGFESGEIGVGYFPPPDLWWPAEPTPTPVAGGHSFTAIGAGYQFSCGLTVNGGIYCWGQGTRGKLGNGMEDNQASPVPILGVERYRTLTVGPEHACAHTTEGRIACWGNNTSGGLGVAATGETCRDGSGTGGRLPCSNRPVYWPAKASVFATIQAGGLFTCGLDQEDQAYCWGSNGLGQLGSGFVGGSSSTPVRVLPPLVK